MLGKNKIKFIQSLSRKKNRDSAGLFIAEGDKLIRELIDSGYQIQTLITTDDKAEHFKKTGIKIIATSHNEIKKISLLKTPQDIIAVCHKKDTVLSSIDAANELIIALDNIQDPGNLGTIIRLASWFGIKNIICSKHTADCYNPKVIQSTMGAIAQVTIHYTDLYQFLTEMQTKEVTVYGTFLKGKNIYQVPLEQSGIIVMGNEGKGISAPVAGLIKHKLVIPSFAEKRTQVESLNVSVATSIVCSEFRRRLL